MARMLAAYTCIASSKNYIASTRAPGAAARPAGQPWFADRRAQPVVCARSSRWTDQLQLPTQTIAGWLAGRFVLLLVILAALVALDAYRDESSLLTAQIKGLVPDAELIARLESGRDSLADFAAAQVQEVNERLRVAQTQTDRALDLRIADAGQGDRSDGESPTHEHAEDAGPVDRQGVRGGPCAPKSSCSC